MTASTMAQMAPPTLVSSIRSLWASKHTVKKDILHPMSGVFQPGTTTLVLGQPGSGKSSLLKLLSGQFHADKNVTIDGSVTYNGVASAAMAAQIPQLTSYAGQREVHYPTLTVKETLAFAHGCSGSVPPRLAQAASPSFLTDLWTVFPGVVAKLMGLQHCEDTVVGNAMLRGVSGGERRRVTMGEMEFGLKPAAFLDEISTGLDSAAAYDIVDAQRSLARATHKTVVIALLQPAPEVYDLFDQLLLLNDGHVLYHGPRAAALDYFAGLGIRCPAYRDVADFLVDLGTAQQDQYDAPASAPRTPEAFADAFRRSSIYAAMLAQLEAAPLPAAPAVAPFAVGFGASTRALLERQLRVYLRNAELVQGRLGLVLIMSLLYSTSFYQVDTTNIITVLGVIFTAVLFLAVGQIPTLPMVLDARAVFYKHKAAGFHRTSSYVLAQCLVQVPFAVLETLVFGSIMYWITGFAAEAGAFLIYLLVLLLTNLVFSTWFFFIGVASPNMLVADPVALLCVMVFVVFAGFIVSAADLPSYLIWLYWIDPLAWVVRALAVNQYSTSEFQTCTHAGIDYCATGGTTFGDALLGHYGIRTGTEWIWYGVAFLVACYVLFMGLAYLALEYIRYDDTDHSIVVVAEEDATDDAYTAGPKTPATVVVAMSTSDRAVTPVTLAFENIKYTVPNPTKGEPDLQLLKGISGFALPGTITALMGSSGAGKTTLMDVIAGRKTGGTIEGTVLLNGYAATDLAIRRSTGYCEQMDIHSETATFREALQFSAMLRQSDDIPACDKLAFAEECLELLDMQTLGDKMIRGSSVEQMKRLTIGVELAAAPSVLFLDEPTSGLDARSAKIVMTGIRKIASTGRTVVCTIHQPSTEVFTMFDSLLLLKRGGETVFFGDLGPNASHMIEYFTALPGTPPLVPGANPATWMLEVIGAGVEARGTASVDFPAAFVASAEHRALQASLAHHTTAHPSRPELTFGSKRAASSWTQCKMVTQRFFRMYWRTPSYNTTRVLVSIFLALFIGLIYQGVNYGTFSGATGGVGMIYLSSLFVGMVTFYSVIPLAVEDRAAFYRERAAQTYNAVWYFVAATVVEVPYSFVTAYAFTVVFYPLVGLNESVAAAAYYGLNLSLFLLLNVYLGQLMAYSMPNVDVAGLLGFLLNSIFMLFMGFAPPASQIPSAYRWLYTVSPPKFTMALLTAETFAKCTDGTQRGCHVMTSVPETVLQAMHVPNITVKAYIEAMYEMKYDDAGLNTRATLLCVLLFLILNAFALRFINHQKK
ncbi:ATP-binding Cassette (ABC) Superfamily [Achlya hypogyna]|uniref:ATP-binding Cassette (ABC) Superfamily n=1 Tax=Achlya hypogyna TaxID=1202772 RepID=A0A1V9Z3U8_ACHHY|nr:ATP-binding Cassette (ABC) Superfamily [Achlya hypogyna]